MSIQKTIAMVCTGGTISMLSQSDAGAVPSVSGEELAKASGFGERLAVHQVANSGGPALSSNDLSKVYHKVRDSLAIGRPTIITVGTDAIEEVAFFLSLVIEPRAPVILTGAMRPHDHPRADGPDNIAASVRTILGGIDDGVYVCIGGTTYPGAKVVKRHTTNVASFTVEHGNDPLDIKIPFRGFALPVIIVKPGLMDDLEYLPTLEVEALVIEASGEGNVPSAAEPFLLDAADRMPVLLTSRVAAGPLGTSYGYTGGSRRLAAAGVIAARWSSPKLRVLASLAVGAFGSEATSFLRDALECSRSLGVSAGRGLPL